MENTGLNLTNVGYDGFFTISGQNSTSNPPPPIGVLWDLSSDSCNGGVGIADGTYDTVDGAMSITIDGNAYGGTSANSNLTTTCSPTTVSFSLGSDVLPKNLTMKRTFYFPTASSESWGRVVDEVTNPTSANVDVTIGYFNNLGSDSGTYFFNVTERYSLSGDNQNATDLEDNLVSFQWSSVDGKNPEGFLDELVVGNGYVTPYWNVTIPAGKTMTFMFIMNQGAFDLDQMHASVVDIDNNPLKLYVEMTEEQIDTLYNFNACSAVAPQLGTVTPTTACTAFGGKAEFDLTSYLAWAPADISVTAHSTDDTTVATNEGTSISVPAGTFTVKLSVGSCAAVSVGQVTVTCPDAPVAPVSTPQSATSSATTLVTSVALLALSVLV